MGDVVNLRRFRKAKRREDDARIAAENRVAFGRTKAEKSLAEAARALETRQHEAHKLEPDESTASTDRPAG